MTKRNYNLDLIKIAACFCVVGLHTVGRNVALLNSAFYYLCSCAVPLFFMVNGALILRKENINISYMIKKIKNLFMVELLWVLLLMLMQFVYQRRISNPVIEIIKPFVQKGTLYQFWFLGSLIIIYFTLPFIIKYVGRDRMKYFMLLCFGVAIIIDIVSTMKRTPLQSNIIQTFRLWTWFGYFLLGHEIMSLSEHLKKKIADYTLWAGTIILTVASVGYQYFSAHYIIDNLFAEYFYGNPIVILWNCFIFLSALRITLKSEKICVAIYNLNKYIMGVYILHPLLIKAIKSVYLFDIAAVNMGLWLIIFGSCLFVSVVLMKIPYLNRLVRL